MRECTPSKSAHVLPVAHVEVGAEQAVQVAQQVQVEGRRHAQRVVVGGFQHGDRLDQVDPDQQRAAGRRRTRLAQQAQRLGGAKLPMLEPG
jgi:hypothetical protein